MAQFRRPDKLALTDAQVELNPHQIQAASLPSNSELEVIPHVDLRLYLHVFMITMPSLNSILVHSELDRSCFGQRTRRSGDGDGVGSWSCSGAPLTAVSPVRAISPPTTGDHAICHCQQNQDQSECNVPSPPAVRNTEEHHEGQ